MADIKHEKMLKRLSDPKNRPRSIVPVVMQIMADRVLKARRLNKKNDKGECTIEGFGKVNKWENKEVGYLVEIINMIKLKNLPPKVYVSQDKNIRLLLYLTQREQFNNTKKVAEASFTLKEYAKLRGYSDREISMGGKFFDELKRDLYSGAYTIYQAPIIIDGASYTLHSSFYSIAEPNDGTDEWKIKWNGFYADYIIKLLNGDNSQYFEHQLQEISDRKTTIYPYLHFFYTKVISLKCNSLCTRPSKLQNILADIGVNEQTLKRPNSCFKVLQRCLHYFGLHYQNEFCSIIFYNNFFKDGITKKITFSNLNNIDKWKYQDVMDILKTINIEDIREVFISFCTMKTNCLLENIKSNELLNDESPERLIEEIIEWAKQWEINNVEIKKLKDRNKSIKFLNDCIKILGYKKVKELFNKSYFNYEANAWDFLINILPKEVKQKK